MIDFLTSYSYLVVCMVMLFLFAVIFWISRKHRRALMLSALLSAPFALTSVFFVPEYWQPQRLWDGITGLEDVIFSFTNGGTVWLVSIWLLRNRIRLPEGGKPRWRRYLQCTLYGSLATASLWYLGLGIMEATLVTIYSFGLLLLWTRMNYWPLALCGGIGFLLAYSLILKTMLTIWPHSLLQWNLQNLSGFFLLGMPIEELGWALGYGIVWPMFMAYVFDARVGLGRREVAY